MRFRIQVELAMEVESLAEAQQAAIRVEDAGLRALGEAVVEDAHSGALSRTSLTPADHSAVSALAAEDLGPGVISERHSGRPAAPDG